MGEKCDRRWACGITSHFSGSILCHLQLVGLGMPVREPPGGGPDGPDADARLCTRHRRHPNRRHHVERLAGSHRAHDDAIRAGIGRHDDGRQAKHQDAANRSGWLQPVSRWRRTWPSTCQVALNTAQHVTSLFTRSRRLREWPLLDSAADRVLPVWTPSGNHLLYVESSGGGVSLRAVRVVSGHTTSRPAVLKREFVKPSGMGFLDEETFAYFVWSGTSDVMVVEASANGSFQGQKARRLIHGGGATMPAWSPDGRWLAWSQAGEIRVSEVIARSSVHFDPS